MNKKVCLMALGFWAGVSSAASAVVWSDEDGVTATKEPAYFYTYADSTEGAWVDETDVNGAKVIDLFAPAGKTSATAGYGFGWKQDASYKDVAISLSTYKGVCMAYEAKQPFRIDFKQSTISDYNYYGAEVPAAASPKKLFVAFADLAQGWKSTTTKAWAVGSQTGVQFSYKNTHANKSGVEENEVIIHSFTLADACPSKAPNVTQGFAGYNNGEIDLDEGAIHTMKMTDVFEDADGDDLTVTVKIVSENNSVVLVDSAAYTGTSTIQFTTASNPEGDAKITLTATDPTKKTATFVFTIHTKDTENLPVAKNSSFEVKEDSTFKLSLANRLTTLGSDADGDEVVLIWVDDPKHGEFTTTANGTFTYTPDKDFFGLDTFTYKFAEKENLERESEIAYGVLKVINVNDAPVVKVVEDVFVDEAGDEHKFGDTLVVDEDFDAFVLSIPVANIDVFDADGDDDYTISAKASAVLNSELEKDADNYLISISAKKDSNGIAKITFAVTDPKISKTVVIAYVKVNPVADPVTPVDDEYEVYQDSVNTIAAKNGVLKNDHNPDKDTTFTLVVDEEPAHGKLTLKNDGSFVYEADEDFEGEDAFGYKVVNADGTESKMAVVILNVLYKNKAPKIVAGVLDTVTARLDTLKEDFRTIYFKKAEMVSWFEDDDTKPADLKFSAVSKDSTLQLSFTTAGALQINSVKDVCGDVSLTLTATDKGGATTDVDMVATLKCVNDIPVAHDDTIYVSGEGATLEYDLEKLAVDVDGDTLIFKLQESVTNNNFFEVTQDGNHLTLVAKEDSDMKEGMAFLYTVKVADPTMASAAKPTTITAKLVVICGADPRDAVKPVIASSKLNWQGAIQGTRGMAAMFDMQGRVMWKSKLPVSESEVRTAAESVQGRKVLRVNQQTFTIK